MALRWLRVDPLSTHTPSAAIKNYKATARLIAAACGSLGFYAETKNKIDNYLLSHSCLVTVEFELTYFNSSSAKQFIQILSRLENNRGSVLWKYPKDNTIMEDRGKELEILLDVPFEFIPV